MNELIFPKKGKTALILIDIQDRLLAAMPKDEGDNMLSHTHVLLELAKDYEWPVYYTEQYPEGLGNTESGIQKRLDDLSATRCSKVEFSCLKNETFASSVLPRLPSSIVIAGMETHVCVLQTAIDLQARGYQTFVPCDAVASRYQIHKENGLQLMDKAGAVILNTESLMFHQLGAAGGEQFKKYSRMIR